MIQTPNAYIAEPFNAMVAAYETWAEPLSARLAQVALERTSVTARDCVLDIGAGTGALALQAAALGATVTAIDLSSAMVARLDQRLAPYPECKALVMDGQALTFEDSTFDAAFCVLSTTLLSNWSAGLDEAVRVVRPGGWLGIVHWANPEGADIFTILSRALKQLPLPTDSPDAPRLTALMSAHELRAALEARGCQVQKIELLNAPSPLPPPESFMDTLDPIYRNFPTYRLLDETMRGELRVLLAREAQRWVEEDVPAGRTAKVHLALARRSAYLPHRSVSAFKELNPSWQCLSIENLRGSVMPNKVIQIFTSTIEIVVSSEASNNSLCVFIETAPPGGGPPPHKHLREDEVFTVLEGQFDFYADGAWLPFHAGETRISLRGNYHAFRNVGSAPGRMMLMTNGGGIDEYFANIGELRLPHDQQRLAEISSYYGYCYLPPA